MEQFFAVATLTVWRARRRHDGCACTQLPSVQTSPMVCPLSSEGTPYLTLGECAQCFYLSASLAPFELGY